MKYFSLVITLFFFAFSAFANDFPAYKIYDSDGDEVEFEDVIEQSVESDIVFFGELHNNPICHWLQLELTKAVYAENPNIKLGFEMFESDDQLVINEFFDDLYSENRFKGEMKLWKNYKTDYKPLLDFAKENKLKLIATNTPRRYATLVAKKSFTALDSLTDDAKKFIAPLPIIVDLELPGYKKMGEMFGEGHTQPKGKMPPAMKSDKKDSTKSGMQHDPKALRNSIPDKHKMPAGSKMHGKNPMHKKGADMMTKLKQAQALKDATMAHFTMSNLAEGEVFIHFNGTYHSNNHEGIVWFIQQKMPDKKIVTIATIEKDDINELTDEEMKLGDFILVIPKSMTITH
jgi:uncharacterized iron-regulated protein